MKTRQEAQVSSQSNHSNSRIALVRISLTDKKRTKTSLSLFTVGRLPKMLTHWNNTGRNRKGVECFPACVACHVVYGQNEASRSFVLCGNMMSEVLPELSCGRNRPSDWTVPILLHESFSGVSRPSSPHDTSSFRTCVSTAALTRPPP